MMQCLFQTHWRHLEAAVVLQHRQPQKEGRQRHIHQRELRQRATVVLSGDKEPWPSLCMAGRLLSEMMWRLGEPVLAGNTITECQYETHLSETAAVWVSAWDIVVDRQAPDACQMNRRLQL